MWRSGNGADGADSGRASVRVLLRDASGRPSVTLVLGAPWIDMAAGTCGRGLFVADGLAEQSWTWPQLCTVISADPAS